jgi:hypothetical protein
MCGEKRNVYRILWRRSKQATGRPGHKFYNIKMDLKETGPEECTGFIWLRICLL